MSELRLAAANLRRAVPDVEVQAYFVDFEGAGLPAPEATPSAV